MTEREPSLLASLRQEEYTGENRCTPCTIANAVIAVVLAAVASAATRRVAGRTAGRVVGLILAGAFAAAIYLRGYLLPGTPTLTKRYLPEEVLGLFDKHPAEGSAPTAFEDRIADRIDADRDESDGEPAGPTTGDTGSAVREETDPEASRVTGESTDGTGGAMDTDEPADDADAPHATDADATDTDEPADADEPHATDADDADEPHATDADDADEPAGDDDSDGPGDDEPEFETVEKIKRRRENAVDPEQFLDDVGAVGPCENRNDLCLTDEFGAAIERHLEGLDDRDDIDERVLADLFSVDPDEIKAQGREYPAYSVGRRIRKWATDGALVLDVATHRALSDRTDRWMDVPVEQRLNILESLRTFQESCPSCGGAVAFGEETVESCCAEYEVIAYKCLDCDQHLVELDPTKIKDGKGVEA